MCTAPSRSWTEKLERNFILSTLNNNVICILKLATSMALFWVLQQLKYDFNGIDGSIEADQSEA